MVRNSCEVKMEPTFYDDLCVNMNPEQRKRNMSLDFNGKTSNKRPKQVTPLLTSPDLIKLSSPEFEKLLNSHGNGEMTPTSILFPKNVTQEQENFSKGFVEALNELHHSDSSQGGLQSTEVSRASSTGTNYVTLETQYSSAYPFDMSPRDSTIVKDEPQTVPNICSSPVSPIDMESQEKYKLERKRLRNRVAASKCRKKKLERIAHLEHKVKSLKGENSDLTIVVNKLRDEVCRLKEQVISHVQSGCKISHQAVSLQHL